MKIKYEYGPERVWIGPVEFNLGETKDVTDEIAESALRDPCIKFSKIEE